MKKNISKIMMVLLMVCGVLLMSYPWISSKINEMNASQVIDDYRKEVDSYSKTHKKEMLEKAKAYNDKLLESKVVMSDPFDKEAAKVTNKEYLDTLDIDGNGLMAYLEIPKIDVYLPIYHGVSQQVLEKAVGHLQGTSLPIGGTGTHTVLSAHTALATARLFTDLDELKLKDTFTVTVLDEVLTYEVYDIEVVEPAEISSLVIDPDEDLCTLVTCTPYGVNTHRLLVHAKRIPTPPESMREHVARDEGCSYIIVAAIIVIFFFLLLILWLRKRRRNKKIRQLRKEVLGHE